MDKLGKILDNTLAFEISNPSPEGLKALVICEQALKQLKSFQITFEDFCEVLADQQVDIDLYLDQIDQNLAWFGI